MALPAAYSEQQLGVYMASVLGPTATALVWSVGDNDAGSFAEAVNDVLLAYGVATIAEATDIGKVRAIARWQAWRWAADALASKFDISTDGQSLSRSQLYQQAVLARDAAFSAVVPHLAVYALTAVPIIHTDDPIDAPIRYAALREAGGD